MSRPNNGSHTCGSGCDHGPMLSEQDIGTSLYPHIDLPKVRCLNESERGSGVHCLKPIERRMDNSRVLISNEDDAELLLFVPFTSAVVFKSFVVRSVAGKAPSSVKIWTNRDDIDFSLAAELPPAQEFNLAEDVRGAVDYPTKVHKFQNVANLTFLFKSDDADVLQLNYLGLKGSSTGSVLGKIPVFVYESAANPADHVKAEAKDYMSSQIK